mmetsp:Transcript_73121/g.116326  ORF Transcript_73121/g.116326 Transcript_73121/m.116326 type:complete len:205 (-) Transcript_73121:437-1051(-)
MEQWHLLSIHWSFNVFLVSVKHQQCNGAAKHQQHPCHEHHNVVDPSEVVQLAKGQLGLDETKENAQRKKGGNDNDDISMPQALIHAGDLNDNNTQSNCGQRIQLRIQPPSGGGAHDLGSTLEEGHGVAASSCTGEPQKDDLHRIGPKLRHDPQTDQCHYHTPSGDEKGGLQNRVEDLIGIDLLFSGHRGHADHQNSSHHHGAHH